MHVYQIEQDKKKEADSVPSVIKKKVQAYYLLLYKKCLGKKDF